MFRYLRRLRPSNREYCERLVIGEHDRRATSRHDTDAPPSKACNYHG